MKEFLISKIIPACLAILAAGLLYLWLGSDTTMRFQVRLPGNDGTPAEVSNNKGQIKIKGVLVKGDGVASQLPGSWPWFRGPAFDNIVTDTPTLARNWDVKGPELLWSLDMGEGYAGAAVLNGRVYVLDYDQEKLADVVRCLSFDDGREIWRYSYPVKIKRNHGMSRTVPAVTDKYVVTLGPKCHVTCLDSVTGEFRWMLNLEREFNAKVPLWYAGQCPIIENEKVILAPGGDALMMAVDCNSGDIVWKTPNPNGWDMTHSSIVPMEFNGKRMYIYCGSGGVVGVSAEDGRILWENTEWKMRTNVPSPLVVGDGLIFLCAGYNQGSMMLKLTSQGGEITAESVFRLEQKVFGSEQHTPIFYEGYIYGVRMDRQLVCLDLQGNVVWSSSSANKFGKGPYIIADGLLYIMNDTGVLTIAEATSKGYSQLAQTKVLDGIDSWGPFAIVSGRMIARDLKRMICLDITQH